MKFNAPNYFTRDFLLGLIEKLNPSEKFTTEKIISFLSTNLPQDGSRLFLREIRQGKFLYFSGDFAGFNHKRYLREGSSLLKKNIDARHLKILEDEIQPSRAIFLGLLSKGLCGNYIFSHYFSLKNSLSMPNTYEQSSFYLRDISGQLIFEIGQLIAVDESFAHRASIQSIQYIPIDKHFASSGYKNITATKKTKALFSSRELEILKCMSTGLSSRQIAEKLFLSEHTVVNHRRNMHEKTRLPNAIALISFAIQSGCI